jgi:hypothetical protein
MNENFSKFPNSPETLSFLKGLYTQTLSDGVITSIEKDFIIKCIKNLSLTSTIISESSKIAFNGTTFDIKTITAVDVGHNKIKDIKTTSSSILHEIAEAVIDSSSDSLTNQYHNHTPMFLNSGSAP